MLARTNPAFLKASTMKFQATVNREGQEPKRLEKPSSAQTTEGLKPTTDKNKVREDREILQALRIFDARQRTSMAISRLISLSKVYSVGAKSVCALLAGGGEVGAQNDRSELQGRSPLSFGANW